MSESGRLVWSYLHNWFPWRSYLIRIRLYSWTDSLALLAQLWIIPVSHPRVTGFNDRLIQLLFKQNSCRVSCCISHIYWKGPQDLDRKRRIVEIRGVGVEKGGIIVGAVTAFWSCFIDVDDGVACEVHCIAKVEVSGRRE